MTKALARLAMQQPAPTLPIEKEHGKSATGVLASLMLTSIDALVMHDSYCCTPPPATAPNLILETHCLTSDRVPHHIKPRGPGHFTQPYWMPHRLNKTGPSTARSHLATALLVISPELLFDPGTGSYDGCRVWVLENRYYKGANCVLWAQTRRAGGATLPLGLKGGMQGRQRLRF